MQSRLCNDLPISNRSSRVFRIGAMAGSAFVVASVMLAAPNVMAHEDWQGNERAVSIRHPGSMCKKNGIQEKYESCLDINIHGVKNNCSRTVDIVCSLMLDYWDDPLTGIPDAPLYNGVMVSTYGNTTNPPRVRLVENHEYGWGHGGLMKISPKRTF